MTSGEPVEIEDRVMLIRIPALYRPGMSDVALFEATRGHWVVGPRRDCVAYAFAINAGIVVEAYGIEYWQPAGTARYVARPQRKDPEGRWEFVGRRADDAIRSKYVGRSVKHYFKQGNQNPIRYVNC